jgi:hypothetical protein
MESFFIILIVIIGLHLIGFINSLIPEGFILKMFLTLTGVSCIFLSIYIFFYTESEREISFILCIVGAAMLFISFLLCDTDFSKHEGDGGCGDGGCGGCGD